MQGKMTQTETNGSPNSELKKTPSFKKPTEGLVLPEVKEFSVF